MTGNRKINTGGGNYNQRIEGDYIQQSGNFAVGVNKGEIKTKELPRAINEAQSPLQAGQGEAPSASKVMVEAVDHAQRFLFGWQFLTVIIGLLMAALVGVGSLIGFDKLLPKQEEQTTQQESSPTGSELKTQPSQLQSNPVEE